MSSHLPSAGTAEAAGPVRQPTRPRTTDLLGVSVVICCHNSASRLGPTLQHLSNQRGTSGIPWEVVVVDNGSTDATSEIARQNWPASAPAPLRIVQEPTLGLSRARERGLAEARYEIVSFVDDDNWVSADWVSLASEIMTSHPEAGACGGRAIAAPDASPPAWFARFAGQYATGEQAACTGDITESRGWLWGAGLVVRKIAVARLYRDQFRTLLTDRRGSELSAGGDIEWCHALRLAGWRIWYDERLVLRHFIPAHRLRWSYLLRMIRGSAASTVMRECYQHAIHVQDGRGLPWHQRKWIATALTCVARGTRTIIRRPLSLLREGSSARVAAEWQWGRLLELLRRREAFDHSFTEIATSDWRRTARPRGGSHAGLRVLTNPFGPSDDYLALLNSHLRSSGAQVDALSFARLLRGRYDVWHLHWPEYLWSYGSAGAAVARFAKLIAKLHVARMAGTRVVVTLHNLVAHDGRRAPWLDRRCWSVFLRHVDGYISLSETARRLAETRHPELQKLPSFVIPLGHYREQYPDRVALADARRELGIAADARVLAFVGQIRRYKNVPHLLRTFAELPDRDLVLLVAGAVEDDALTAEIRDAARRDGRVRCELARVDRARLPLLLGAADLVVLPFRSILNSASALLALSLDRPVLVPALGSLTELREEVGVDWVRCYTGELTAPELSSALRWAAAPRRHARAPLTRFDWESIARDTLAVYRELGAS